MPSSGCNALSSDGTWFNTFATLGRSWHDARIDCLLRGYDLATITSGGGEWAPVEHISRILLDWNS